MKGFILLNKMMHVRECQYFSNVNHPNLHPAPAHVEQAILNVVFSTKAFVLLYYTFLIKPNLHSPDLEQPFVNEESSEHTNQIL